MHVAVGMEVVETAELAGSLDAAGCSHSVAYTIISWCPEEINGVMNLLLKAWWTGLRGVWRI